MSKHTNKVHGKLNFLMIAVVVVIGAVSYLLVQSGTIDPSLGTSSGIKGVKKADKYVSKNDVVVELDGEEIQDVLNNPDFQRMIASGEFQKLASDEDFVKVLDNKDGIGILGDIFRSLDFVNNIDINKGDLSGDPTQSRAGNGDNKRGLAGSSGSMQNANSDNPNIVGQRGNPANNDSGINGMGGAVLLGAINPASLNKISDFQKFMKGAEFQKFMKSSDFQKFMKGAEFQKFMKSQQLQKNMKSSEFNFSIFIGFVAAPVIASTFFKGADFEKFAKGAEFQKFMKGAEFQKFMKGAELQKFMKDAQLQKFMMTADLEKFAKGADFEKFAKSSSFQKFAKNEDFAKFMMRGDFQKFMKSSAYAKFAKGQTFEKFMKGADFQKFMKETTFQKKGGVGGNGGRWKNQGN